MKKIIFLAAALFCIQSKAQTINSITIVPSTPTTADNILILAECMFTSGSCDQHTQGFNVAGNNISAWALHCVGMLTVICTDTDTFSIGMLSAGTYIVTYQVDQGFGGPPCTPGIVPGPTMTTTFTVSTTTDINKITAGNTVSIYPNPAGDFMEISYPETGIRNIEIFNIYGQRVKTFSLPQNFQNRKLISIDISGIEKGIYFIRIESEKSGHMMKIIKE